MKQQSLLDPEPTMPATPAERSLGLYPRRYIDNLITRWKNDGQNIVGTSGGIPQFSAQFISGAGANFNPTHNTIPHYKKIA